MTEDETKTLKQIVTLAFQRCTSNVQNLFLEITAPSAECFLLYLSHLLIHISNLLSHYLPAQSKFSFFTSLVCFCFFVVGRQKKVRLGLCSFFMYFYFYDSSHSVFFLRSPSAIRSTIFTPVPCKTSPDQSSCEKSPLFS